MSRSWLKERTVKQMTATQAAWVAGFFDGEGTIAAYKGGRGGKYLSYIIQLPNTHKGSLDFVQKVTGAGRVTKRSMKGRASHHKQQYLWKLSSQRDIVAFCEQILPFLIVKKEEVEDFLSNWKDIK